MTRLSVTSGRIWGLQGGVIGLFLLCVGVVFLLPTGAGGPSTTGVVLAAALLVLGALLLYRATRLKRRVLRNWPHLEDDGRSLSLIHTDGRRDSLDKRDVGSVDYDLAGPGRWSQGRSVLRPLAPDGDVLAEWSFCPYVTRKELAEFLRAVGLTLAPKGSGGPPASSGLAAGQP